MPQAKISVFISAVTRDLGTFREIVRNELLTAGFFPVLQEHFRPDSQSLIGFLERTIAECEVVVCLLGPSCGDGPMEPAEGRRSFTQMEYDIARRFAKPAYVFIASKECPLDNPVEGDQLARQLQCQHIEKVMNDVKCDFFSSQQSLREKILRLIPLLPRISRGITPPEPHFIHRPKEPPFFAGRRVELEQLSTTIAQPTPAIVAVLGIGGQGKTTLAWEWFKRSGSSRFTGVIWCTAYRNGFTFDMFLDEALTYLLGDGFDKRQIQDSDARMRRLVGFLQTAPYLLVVDGLERWLRGWATDEARQQADERDDRAASQNCMDDFFSQVSSLSNGTHLLFTSRTLPACLDDAKYAVIPVDAEGKRAMLEGLDDEAAIHLLQAAGVQGSAGDLIPVVRRYNNHPLALSVLGSLVAEAYGGRIDRLSDVSALDHKRRLFELFEETRKHLPRRDLLVRYLAIAAHFIENPSLGPLSALLAPEAEKLGIGSHGDRISKELRDVTVALAKWNLIGWDATGEIIQLHPLIKEYFGSLVSDSAQIHARLAHWYAQQVVDAKASTMTDARMRCLAVEHALRTGDIEHCAELMFSPFAGINSFAEWLGTWGHLTTGIDLLARLAAAAPPDQACQFSISRGAMLRQLGRLDAAVAVLTQVIDRLAGKQRGLFNLVRVDLCGALVNRGNSQRELGELTLAITDYDTALACLPKRPWESTRVSVLRADVITNRSNVLRDFGHLSRAIADSDEAVALYKELMRRGVPGLGATLCAVLVNRANVYADRDQFALAALDYEAARKVFQGLLNSDRKEARLLLAHLDVMQGAALTDSGQPDKAIALLEIAMAVLKEMVDEGRSDLLPLLGLTWMNLGRARFQAVNGLQGQECLDEAVRIFDHLASEGRKDIVGWHAWALLDRAEARYRAGDLNGSGADRERGFQMLDDMIRQGMWVFRTSLVKKAFQAINYLHPSMSADAARLLLVVCRELSEAIMLSKCTEKLAREFEKGCTELLEVLPRLQPYGVDIKGIGRLRLEMAKVERVECPKMRNIAGQILQRLLLRSRGEENEIKERSK